MAHDGQIRQAIAAGDFTGNQVLDLAVANEGSDNVSILSGNGQGTFQPLSLISLGNDPFVLPNALVAGNFNGDGLTDLAVVSQSFDFFANVTDNVTILLDAGQGLFDVQPSIGLGTFLSPVSIAAGDFFDQGHTDLAVADTNAGQVYLLEGDGQGKFVLQQSALDLGSGGAPITLTTGSFTGDGEIDLAVTRQDPNSVAIELNQGNGQFAQPASVSLVTQNTPVVADFTGDGVPDVAIVDGAGDILFRQGVANEPGSFEPPVTINRGYPSRDIAAVTFSEGILLASVDADDNAVSLFAYRNGAFSRIGSLATGQEPAQIVSVYLSGSGDDDLIIRNAGDGTLTIYLSNPLARTFDPPITLAVGPGISDVSVAYINQDDRRDILLANQISGEVEVIMNLGYGNFSQPTLYRAGVGLSAVVGGDGTIPLSVLSQDGTVGVAAAALAPGEPKDIVALDSGSDTLGVLDGFGGGLFANPYSLPTTGSTSLIRTGDFTGNGTDDLAILGQEGLNIYLGNGQGGFVQDGAPYDVGPDPTGLTIADVNRDNIPDLVVGNAFGDVLVLLGNGNGTFHTPIITDQSVSLAVVRNTGAGGPTFVFADQARDRVVAENGTQGQPTVVADRTTGLLVPGTPVLADLNNNGVMDLIVPNTGGNNVFVYPELPTGGFGPSLNDGNGFSTGTNPVSVSVADLTGNGRLDLIVANMGSNDVSILINEPLGDSFTPPVQGPRLRAGVGPVAVLYGDFTGNGVSDLLVSDSGSNDVLLLPGLGDGFFDDTSPIVLPLTTSPGPIFAGPFVPGTGTDIVALNSGTGDVTLISDLSTGAPVTQVFSSGGFDPVAALVVPGLAGSEGLLVADADGRVALLVGGTAGLTVADVIQMPDGLHPTALALATIQNNSLDVYAAAEGQESASILVFALGGPANASGSGGGQSLTLLPLQESSLPLIATFLTPYVNLNSTEGEAGGAEGVAAGGNASGTSSGTSFGQGPLGRAGELDEEPNDDELDREWDAPATDSRGAAARSPWIRALMGLEEAFDEFRHDTRGTRPSGDGPQEEEETHPPDNDQPEGPLETSQKHTTDRAELVDAAIESMPALGCERFAPITKARHEPVLLTSMARSILTPTSRDRISASAFAVLFILEAGPRAVTPRYVRGARYSPSRAACR